MKTRYFILILSVTFLISAKTKAQDPDWVKENTWYFDNFVKDTLPWSIFRETFIGVAPAPSADFDQIFYDAIYQTKLAGPGHCYGMDVLAMVIMKNGGYLGYCHPPYTYSGSYASPSPDTLGPSDPNLKTAIEIMHGYQINHGFLSYLLDVIAISKNRDGRYAFQQVNYYLAKNDPPVISVTENLSPADGGHVLIPYFTSDLGGTKRIYVYDPNRSYYEPGAEGHDWYINGNNYIEVNSGSGLWKFTMADGDVWTGNPGGGGNLIAIPLSVAGKKDRLPQSLLADGAYALNTIFIFGDVKIEQISDPLTKRHYLNKDGTNIEAREEKRLNNILPFVPLDGSTSPESPAKNAVYFYRGANPVDLQYRACGDYRVGMIFHGNYFEVKGKGDGSIQHFKTANFQKGKKQAMKMILPHSKIKVKQPG